MAHQNKLYDEISLGETAQIRRTCTADDFYIFAVSSGNLNPMHLAEHDGDGDGATEAVAPSSWVGALISAVLGNLLPGPGMLYRSQALRFDGRARIGDTLVAQVWLTEKRPDGIMVFRTTVSIEGGDCIASGEAEVIAPPVKLRFDRLEVPGLILQRHRHFDAMLARAEPLPPIPTAVVMAQEAQALSGALLAARHTLITPILLGDEAAIRRTAQEIGADLTGIPIEHEPDAARAAALGVALVREGRAAALMKGHLHTDILLHAILHREHGLRTARRLSHIFVMDVPGLPRPLMVSDAAITIAPTLEEKADIIQNAIDLGHALGLAQPLVGVLSAIETVNPRIPSTLDAAALSKMAERGQITGGLVDGPLAMDNAIDLAAARTKGITSMVAGRADILVVPNLEAGNMLAKQLTYAAHAEAGGIALGASVPVILTSRADSDKARLASCALAALYADWRARGAGR